MVKCDPDGRWWCSLHGKLYVLVTATSYNCIHNTKMHLLYFRQRRSSVRTEPRAEHQLSCLEFIVVLLKFPSYKCQVNYRAQIIILAVGALSDDARFVTAVAPSSLNTFESTEYAVECNYSFLKEITHVFLLKYLAIIRLVTKTKMKKYFLS